MGDFFVGKRVLIISPQPWDHIEISKHHYAKILGQRNEVYFLQPPDFSLPRGAIRMHASNTPGVTVAQWRPLTPRWFRFHVHSLYTFLIRRDVKRIREAIGQHLDVLWCFDFNMFPDLRAFGADVTIFHPVDPLSSPRQAAIGRSADLILSVSEKILSAFERAGVETPRSVINHGIGSEFAELSRAPVSPGNAEGTIHCGYFGNLDRGVISVPLLAKIAERSPSVIFHFWGPARPAGPLRMALSSRPNCLFHGTLGKHELAEAVAKMDCFVIAYNDDPNESDRSNSHKLLEYFATGRAIISTRMECYDDADLMVMSRAPDDSDFPALFLSVIADINTHNSVERCARRKAFAANCTYERRIAEISILMKRLGIASDRSSGS